MVKENLVSSTKGVFCPFHRFSPPFFMGNRFFLKKRVVFGRADNVLRYKPSRRPTKPHRKSILLMDGRLLKVGEGAKKGRKEEVEREKKKDQHNTVPLTAKERGFLAILH